MGSLAIRNVPRTAPDPAETVWRAIPSSLMRALNDTIPLDVWEEAHRQLDLRTPAELVARMKRRWGASWEDGRWRDHRPADVLHALIVASDCGNPRCEDGWLIRADPPARCPWHAIDRPSAPGAVKRMNRSVDEAPLAGARHRGEMAERARAALRSAPGYRPSATPPRTRWR